jgi:hypothetical protein
MDLVIHGYQHFINYLALRQFTYSYLFITESSYSTCFCYMSVLHVQTLVDELVQRYLVPQLGPEPTGYNMD